MSKRISNTKQRILEAALTLFSTKGYELATVAEIAASVGIKAPSLYKHYKCKQDIYEAIIDEMDRRHNEHMPSIELVGGKSEKDIECYSKIDEDELIRYGLELFNYHLHDEYVNKVRRMLTLTQFTNRSLSNVFVQRYIGEPLKCLERSFKVLMESGRLVSEDPRVMALQYYAPLYLLLSLCDRHSEMEQDAVRLMELHIRQFIRMYGNTSKK